MRKNCIIVKIDKDIEEKHKNTKKIKLYNERYAYQISKEIFCYLESINAKY